MCKHCSHMFVNTFEHCTSLCVGEGQPLGVRKEEPKHRLAGTKAWGGGMCLALNWKKEQCSFRAQDGSHFCGCHLHSRPHGQVAAALPPLMSQAMGQGGGSKIRVPQPKEMASPMPPLMRQALLSRAQGAQLMSAPPSEQGIKRRRLWVGSLGTDHTPKDKCSNVGQGGQTEEGPDNLGAGGEGEEVATEEGTHEDEAPAEDMGSGLYEDHPEEDGEEENKVEGAVEGEEEKGEGNGADEENRDEGGLEEEEKEGDGGVEDVENKGEGEVEEDADKGEGKVEEEESKGEGEVEEEADKGEGEVEEEESKGDGGVEAEEQEGEGGVDEEDPQDSIKGAEPEGRRGQVRGAVSAWRSRLRSKQEEEQMSLLRKQGWNLLRDYASCPPSIQHLRLQEEAAEAKTFLLKKVLLQHSRGACWMRALGKDGAEIMSAQIKALIAEVSAEAARRRVRARRMQRALGVVLNRHEGDLSPEEQRLQGQWEEELSLVKQQVVEEVDSLESSTKYFLESLAEEEATECSACLCSTILLQ